MLAPAATPTVRAAALDGLAELVGSQGVDFSLLLQRQGLAATLLSDPDNRLSFRLLAQVLDAAAHSTGDDCIGLHLGAVQSIHITGILGYALQASPDVRTQIAHASRYYALHQDGASVELKLRDQVATLSYAVYDAELPMHRHDAEATLALCVNQIRVHTGQPQWAPSSVHFAHPAPQPGSERELRRFFACPVYFGEPFDGLRFPAAFLDTPIRMADAGLLQILTRYAEECLQRHADAPSLTGRVRRLIASGLGSGLASAEEVAGRLGLSTRTLQRRLLDEGHQFSDLVDDTRRELAARYLGDARISLTDAAFLVGYSDLTAFHRAFRRWFGQTPLTYQRQLQLQQQQQKAATGA